MDGLTPDEDVRYKQLIRWVRQPAGGAWERDPELLTDALRLAWKLWICDSDPPTEEQREFIERCLHLIIQEDIGKRSESLDLIASCLLNMPAGTSEELQRALKTAAVTLLDLQSPTGAARKLLVQAAEREADYGFGHVLYLALGSLPHSLGKLAKILPTATTNKPDLVARYQRLILTCQDKDCVEEAFRLLYLGPGTQWPAASLQALEELKAPPEAWLGVARAALERPKLQAPLMAQLLESPRPFLLPAIAWIWVYGAPSAHGAAEKLLQRSGTSAEIPILEQQVPRPTALIDACQARRGNKPLLSLEKAVPPWTAEDRLYCSALIGGAPADAQTLEPLRRLGSTVNVASTDLLLELVQSLEQRMGEPEVFEIFLKKCIESQSLRLLSGIAAVLVPVVARGVRVPGEERAVLATRAPEIVEGRDSSLALARLALPDSLEFWRKHRKKLLPATWVPEEDQALAFALLPLEPQPLQIVYEDATPNLRRLLLGRANFAQFPAAAPFLLRWLSLEDPSSLPIFLKRLLEQKPEGLLGLLADLTGQDLPEPIRTEAVHALGELGGRSELMVLGALKGVDTTAARAAILGRLSAQGQELQGGGLEIAATGGELVAAEAPVGAPSVPPPSAARDARMRLLPPPRALSPMLGLAYVVLAPNGWGVIWTNLALAVMVAPQSPLRDQSTSTLILGILPFFINHFLCSTVQELRGLRNGVLLAATVEVETTKKTGKNKGTNWHHRLVLLADDGRLHQQTITESGRLDLLLDEKHEPVLATLDPAGALKSLIPLDNCLLIEVNSRGLFQLRRRALGLLALASLPWWPVLYDYLT